MGVLVVVTVAVAVDWKLKSPVVLPTMKTTTINTIDPKILISNFLFFVIYPACKNLNPIIGYSSIYSNGETILGELMDFSTKSCCSSILYILKTGSSSWF